MDMDGDRRLTLAEFQASSGVLGLAMDDAHNAFKKLDRCAQCLHNDFCVYE